MIAIVSDVHLHNWNPFSSITSYGVNTRLLSILNSLLEVANKLNKGDRMYIAGDLFHVRGNITPSVQNPTIELFSKLVKEHGIQVRIIPGNHDLESKDTSKLTNAVQALKEVGCEICNEPTYYEDDMVYMIPWIDSLDDLREAIDEASKKVPYLSSTSLIIHAPLNGVISIPDNGLSPEELEEYGFARVFCGHYHNHKNFNDKVFSVGALTHQTWSDVDSLAGFILIDKNKVSHHETSAPKFVDFNEELEESEIKESVSNNYVRVKLGEATEQDILKIKDAIVNEYDALACHVISTPQPIGASRTKSISGGESIQKSIKDWIDENLEKDLSSEVYSECELILNDIEEV